MDSYKRSVSTAGRGVGGGRLRMLESPKLVKTKKKQNDRNCRCNKRVIYAPRVVLQLCPNCDEILTQISPWNKIELELEGFIFGIECFASNRTAAQNG